jgi:hypothetical protein
MTVITFSAYSLQDVPVESLHESALPSLAEYFMGPAAHDLLPAAKLKQ